MSGLANLWAELEQQYSLPSGFLARTRHIESRGNPNAVSPTGATGPFQFTKGTARQYGLPLSSRTDEVASAQAAARLAADNRGFLAKKLGREPTGAELYLAHQQGAGGAAGLLANMNKPAGSVTDPYNIKVNNGNPNAPASEFVQQFLAKYEGAKPGQNRGQGPTKTAMDPRFDPNSLTPAFNPTAVQPPAAQIAQATPPPAPAAPAPFMSGAKIGNVMGAGLGMIAQGLGGGGSAPPPPPPLPPVEDHVPDMSLLAMLGKKRKRLI